MLALKLLESEFSEGQTIEVDCQDDHLIFAAITTPESAEDAEEKEKV